MPSRTSAHFRGDVVAYVALGDSSYVNGLKRDVKFR
jgi:hypothetical protein